MKSTTQTHLEKLNRNIMKTDNQDPYVQEMKKQIELFKTLLKYETCPEKMKHYKEQIEWITNKLELCK